MNEYSTPLYQLTEDRLKEKNVKKLLLSSKISTCNHNNRDQKFKSDKQTRGFKYCIDRMFDYKVSSKTDY